MKHTPGPWGLTKTDAWFSLEDGKGRIICDAHEWTGKDNNDEMAMANAKLIAAAPEMLSALEEILIAIEKDYGDQKTDSSIVAQFYNIQSLVKKAKGEL